MKKALIFILITFLYSFSYSQGFFPPKTPAMPVKDTLHGMILTDDYRWLEDKTDPRVIEWTQAQHDYGIKYLTAGQKIHPGLREGITSHIDLDYEGPFSKQGKRIFQNIKRKGDKQYKIYTLLDGKKRLIWDPVTLDTSGNTSTTGVNYTYDGDRAAVTVQKSGAEIPILYIIDTRTGKVLNGPLSDMWNFQWTNDQQHGYYTLRSQEAVNKQLPLKAYRWKVGDPIDKAEFIGTTTDAKNSFFIYDNRYSDVTFFGESDFYSNKLMIRNTGTMDEGKIIYESKKSNAYPVAIGDKLYVMTNDNAPNFRLMVADKKNPEYANWKVLIPESENVMQDYEITKSNIIIQDKKDILSRLTLYDLEGKKIKEIELPELGNVANIRYEREEDSIYIQLNTFTSPPKVFVASPSNFKWRLFYEQKTAVNMNDIVGELKFYTGKDGTKIPAFVIHKKGMKLDGNNPVLLYGYGGFNSGISPSFYGLQAAFLNAGGVFVNAGIRGGNEYGEKWHLGAMNSSKHNSFDDFNACAEWLISEKYTNPNRLAAMGGSNGGLLMGAIALQRPDLYKAVVCQVPLLDMIRYQKFLIARYWIPEYGTSEKEEDFRWLLQYSPYQNIRKGVNVPAMLVTAGANDSRVDPLHAKKYVAALQNNPGQINPVILYIDYKSGHGSGQSTAHIIDNWTWQYEFVMNQLGM